MILIYEYAQSLWKAFQPRQEEIPLAYSPRGARPVAARSGKLLSFWFRNSQHSQERIESIGKQICEAFVAFVCVCVCAFPVHIWHHGVLGNVSWGENRLCCIIVCKRHAISTLNYRICLQRFLDLCSHKYAKVCLTGMYLRWYLRLDARKVTRALDVSYLSCYQPTSEGKIKGSKVSIPCAGCTKSLCLSNRSTDMFKRANWALSILPNVLRSIRIVSHENPRWLQWDQRICCLNATRYM